MDHPVLSGEEGESWQASWNWFDPDAFFGKQSDLSDVLYPLKEVAIETNREWADKLGIQRSTAITAVKPSGTVSQLVDSASGIHARYSPYYIRTVRGDNKDPLTVFLKEQGVPNEPALGKEDSTTVFSFPIKSPESSVMENDMSAIEQLELWKVYQDNWCEHKPSVTVYYSEAEYPSVMAWLWDNFDDVSGISLLPKSDHTYKQAPYQEITKEEFETMSQKMPTINWDEFIETEDNTESSQTLSCTGSSCEVVDIGS
jgi:ribonucleoside-diphosphate reductase alpha chain